MRTVLRFYTVSDLAKQLKLNPITIQHYIREGKLAALRLGRSYRVSHADLLRFLNSSKVGNV